MSKNIIRKNINIINMSPNLDDCLLNEDYQPKNTIKLNKSDITEFQNLLGDIKNYIELIKEKFNKAEDCI